MCLLHVEAIIHVLDLVLSNIFTSALETVTIAVPDEWLSSLPFLQLFAICPITPYGRHVRLSVFSLLLSSDLFFCQQCFAIWPVFPQKKFTSLVERLQDQCLVTHVPRMLETCFCDDRIRNRRMSVQLLSMIVSALTSKVCCSPLSRVCIFSTQDTECHALFSSLIKYMRRLLYFTILSLFFKVIDWSWDNLPSSAAWEKAQSTIRDRVQASAWHQTVLTNALHEVHIGVKM